MNYAKLNEGVLEYAPVNYTTASGSLIVNFNKNVTLMKRYGFKEVIDQRPSYDELTEYLTISGYTETEDNIQVIYTVKQMDMIEAEESLDEKVKQLKATDTDHEMAMAELADMVIELMGGMM